MVAKVSTQQQNNYTVFSVLVKLSGNTERNALAFPVKLENQKLSKFGQTTKIGRQFDRIH